MKQHKKKTSSSQSSSQSSSPPATYQDTHLEKPTGGGTGSPPRSSEPRRTAEGMSRLNLPSFNHWEKSPRGYEYIYPLHLQPPATSDHQSVTAPASWPCI
ncbi:hypothetical protein VZT92_021746 [Zoarces viviparus]|uniref:Uncharacterized protein n=1 Tax=Zoarces viviparus TaxID=48416 RepID=A0AAW1EAZ2_ZOAVI